MELVIGVDIGQQVDPTAVAVAEVTEERTPTFTIRFLERLVLRTPYPEVGRRVAAIAAGALKEARTPRERLDPNGWRVHLDVPNVSLTIVTDITGVGRPVHEIIEAEVKAADVHARFMPATFTYGDRLTSSGGGGKSVGKSYLVSRLQALLQTDRIKLPRTREAEALAKELLDYEIRIDQDANEKYGAFRVGAHDDLVTAVGLAVLKDWYSQPSMAFSAGGARIA